MIILRGYLSSFITIINMWSRSHNDCGHVDKQHLMVWNRYDTEASVLSIHSPWPPPYTDKLWCSINRLLDFVFRPLIIRLKLCITFWSSFFFLFKSMSNYTTQWRAQQVREPEYFLKQEHVCNRGVWPQICVNQAVPLMKSAAVKQ